MGAYRAARAHTSNLLLIEGEQYGTTCARVGCMPSKLLIAAAEAAHDVANASRFGVRVDGKVRIDGRDVMARVRRERDRFVGFVVDAVEEWPAETRTKGRVRFLDDHTLAVDNRERVEADRIVIATGSRTNRPATFEALGDRMVVNDDVFDWEDLPGSVVVFGAGVIGLELGQALSRLGVRVRIFGKGGGVALLTDPEVRAAMLAAMREGLDFDPDAEVTSVSRENDSVVVRFSENGAAKIERFEYLLAATGRRPNVDGLGLEGTSLELDERGVPKFDRFTMQCGDGHVFIAGDVNGDIPLLHEAADQGRIAGENAGRFPDVRAGLRRTPLSVVFTDPNIASIGRSYRSLEASGTDFAIGAVDFSDQGRSRVILKNRGVLRVYAEHGTGLLLGAEMVGPRMEHVAHLLAWAHQKRMTISEMLDMPFYHPVIEEGVRSALRDANAKLHLGPAMDPRSLDCGPGA
jgi:dihydrolipoamide dehydrogenase